ncbi:2'-5' RNA ligase family protein [Streptomyces sp. GESEQ-35]|uniref:2'-5' RNA ligase family protein n=1 Tax=Streptomyces sp. GESEQ-35 TaxID=2812657 RepID=UPI001B34446A|nr:2'-5' RNA ligase family protein [Streptomyces sp. GESEQ-35]
MDRYLTGGTLWPDGWTKLRVDFVPRLPEIKPVTDAYRPVLTRFGFVSPVKDEWLHETLAVVDDRPAREVTGPELALFESRLRERLGGLPAFTVTVGGAVAGRRGVLLDLAPDTEFVELRHQARDAVVEVFGEEADDYEEERPRVALAYGTASGDSRLLQGRLRSATAQRATLTVDGVRLVEAVQDRKRHEIRWQELAFVPLGGAG